MENRIDPLRSVLLAEGPRGILPELGILGLRLGFGLTMAWTHGRGTLSGFLENPVDYPDPLGLGSQVSMGLMVFAELFCALAVAAGFLTRLALVPLVAGMGTAFFVFHAADPFGRKELAFLYLMVWVVLLISGPGRFSLDRLVFGRGGRSRAAVTAALAVASLMAPVALAESWIEGGSPREPTQSDEEVGEARELNAWLQGGPDGEQAGRPSAMPTGPTLASYRRGLELVEEGLAIMGGLEALTEAGGISLAGSGTLDLSTRMQGMHPDRPDPVGVEERLAVDLEGSRVAYETHARVNPDADEWIRYHFDDRGRMLVVLRGSGQAFWVPGDEAQKRRYERVVPQLLLRDALARRQTLRHLGRFGDQEAVTFTLEGGESVTLFFEADTGLLGGFEYLLDLPLLGDTPIGWRFDPYLEIEGLGRYPGGYRIYRRGRLFKAVRFDVIRAGGADAEVFQEPAGLSFPEPPPPAPEEQDASGGTGASSLPEVRILAEGVHLAMGVRSGFHVLFVELEESVLVVDAPAGYHELQMVPAMDWAGEVTSSSVGRRLLAAIRATVPGKPVRYVVLTHHHGDHAGGIRPFLAAGATVLTSAVTKPVVERAARATFTLGPDELTGRAATPRIDVVEGERTITDGKRTIRILDVGRNPHAEGMLVVHLPEEGILYQSDLFMPSGGSFPDLARVPVMRWFVEWLDHSGLEPESIYAIHGSARVTEEQLETIRSWDGSHPASGAGIPDLESEHP